MAKKKYVVKGLIMGVPVGSVIAVEEDEVLKQNLGTILEEAPKGATLTEFDEDGLPIPPKTAGDEGFTDPGANPTTEPKTVPPVDPAAKPEEKKALVPPPPPAPKGTTTQTKPAVTPDEPKDIKDQK